MKKYKINDGFREETSVEASEYKLASGFFWFYDDKNELVMTYAAEKVLRIRLVS